MYGPQGRGKALLMVFGTLFVFSGVLALPFLVDHEVVRVGFGMRDGLTVQGGGSDLGVPDVLAGPDLRAPRALVTTPASSGDAAFRVGWDHDGPDAGIAYVFHLQYAAVSVEEDDEIAWQDWFRLRRAELPREAVFTGAPGETYTFRARTCDLGLVCGAWSDTATTQVLAEATEPVVDLHVIFRSPLPDEVVGGRIGLAWDYDHEGPGSALVDVLVRPGEQEEWTPLYSGSGLSAVWDTTRHEDGTYLLRLRLSDGIHHVEEEVPVGIANERVVPPPVAEERSEPPNETSESRESNAPLGWLPLVGLLLCGAILQRHRRP